MDKSIRKSITINEINYIFQVHGISEDKQAKLIPLLFENPETQQVYLLKPNLLTLRDLTSKVKEIIDQENIVSDITSCFYVKDDLIIPAKLRRVLLGNEPMALFIGAGVSRLLEIPLWNELANKAIDHLRETDRINHTEASQLRLDSMTPKQMMSIFHQIVKDKNEIKKFYEKQLSAKEISKDNPYEILFEIEEVLKRPITKISTNLDLEWEKVLKKKNKERIQAAQDEKGKTQETVACYDKTQFGDFKNGQVVSDNILYQIHGSMHDLDSAILTTSQYINGYRENDELRGFLEEVFKTHVVLFIGSSVQEFEILEHCLKEAHTPLQHFALVGTRLGEENLFRIKRAYFSDIQVQTIPYYLDFHNYDRLLYVLKAWRDEIRSSRNKQFYEDTKMIDEVV